MNDDDSKTLARRMKHVRWRDLNDFEGVQISEEGDVRTWKRGKTTLGAPRRIAPYLHTNGRWVVKLIVGCKRMNRALANLVLLAFCGDPPSNVIRSISGHPEVDFKDGDVTNVDILNLKWSTRS